MFGLGSQSQLGIGIAVMLQDKFSGKAQQINQQLIAMRKNTQTAAMSAVRDYRNNAAVITAAASGISYGMLEMAKSGAEYQHTLNQIAIVGGKDLGKSRQQLNDFTLDLSKKFSRTPQAIAKAMFENVKAGVTNNLEEITRYQIAVATATDEMLEGEQGVAFQLLGIANQFEIPMSKFASVANAVTASANASMASVLDLGESMQYFGNTAHIAGLSMEQTLAILAKLSQARIRGSIAGTAASNMIQHATNSVGMFQSKKSAKAWAAMGVDSNYIVSLINQAKWFELMDYVDKATTGMKRQPKLALLNAVFGIRGEKALLNMFGQGKSDRSLGYFLQKAQQGEAQDVAMKQSKAMMKDLYSDFLFVGNAFHRFKVKFTEAAAPFIRVLANVTVKLLNVLGAIASTPIGKVLVGVVTVMAPLIAIMFAFRTAALTATIALNGFSRTASVGGFSGMMQAGLGMVGMGRFGQYGGMMGTTVGRNAAGRLFVKAGQSVNFGGKLYKGGQMLPGAFANAAGLSMMAGEGAMGAVTSTLGKVAPWLGRIAGFGLRWLPVIGWIYTGFEVIRGIYNLLSDDKDDDKKQQVDPLIQNFYKNLDAELTGRLGPKSWYKNNADMYANKFDPYKKPQELNQTINIHVGGQKVGTVNLNNALNNAFEDEVTMNLNDHN